jgi:2-polyprenyl-3-methyl-5-hydroxy-6-metoxy-1,4-benzoquinol methylase
MITPPRNKKFYTREECLALYSEFGLHRTITGIYKNILKQRGKISSADVSMLYDEAYAAAIESQAAVKTTAGFDINYYMLFAYNFIVQNASEGASVLDIGCGKGRLCFALSAHGLSVTGTDFDTAAIASAGERAAALESGNKPDFISLAADQINGNFDFIILSDVAEHLSPTELEALFRECIRLLKPGGCIVLHTPNGRLHFRSSKRCRIFDLFHLWKHLRKLNAGESARMNYLEEAYYDQVHINIMTPVELRNLLNNAGFKNIRTFYRDDVPLGLNRLGLSGSFGMTAVR